MTFREQLEAGNVATVTARGERIEGRFNAPIRQDTAEAEPSAISEFLTYVPSFGDEELFGLLEAQGVEVRTEPEEDSSLWPVLFTSLLPFLILIALGYFIVRQMRSRGQNILSTGKSRAKL